MRINSGYQSIVRRKKNEMVGRDCYHTTLLGTESELGVKNMASREKAVK